LLRQGLLLVINMIFMTFALPILIVKTHGVQPLQMKPEASISHSATKMKNRQGGNFLSGRSISPIHLGWITSTWYSIGHLRRYRSLSDVSPVLGTIEDDGQVDIRGNADLVSRFHKSGMRVWGRVVLRRDTYDQSHSLLSDPSRIQSVAVQLGKSAKQNRWDGVNVDIENVSPTDRYAFSHFIKQLGSALHPSHIPLSVDIPPDSHKGENTHAAFDHRVLGKWCDYVVLMGYDQHWAMDPISGPITSLPWLIGGVKDLLATGIPSSKIVLGLPSYTRLWILNPRGKVLRNPAFSTASLEKLLKAHHRDLTWDDHMKEYYTQFKKNGKIQRVWLEDDRSLNTYLSLVKQYHLAGSAIWSLNLMAPEDWNRLY
jgi:hypothetical protein